MVPRPSGFSLSNVFSVADQSRSSEMIMISQSLYINMTCNLEHSSTTLYFSKKEFELPTWSVTSEENGLCVNMENETGQI